ncbi:15925_t:CDS:2, partial [Entrophospora sp. SA101]
SSSNSISPDGSLFSTSPSSAHFPDSIKGEWDSDTEEDEEAREKRRKFAQLRSKHYNMKEALKLGLKLVEKDMTGDKGKEKEQEETHAYYESYEVFETWLFSRNRDNKCYTY